jgi:hypothetical protein
MQYTPEKERLKSAQAEREERAIEVLAAQLSSAVGLQLELSRHCAVCYTCERR